MSSIWSCCRGGRTEVKIWRGGRRHGARRVVVLRRERRLIRAPSPRSCSASHRGRLAIGLGWHALVDPVVIVNPVDRHREPLCGRRGRGRGPDRGTQASCAYAFSCRGRVLASLAFGWFRRPRREPWRRWYAGRRRWLGSVRHYHDCIHRHRSGDFISISSFAASMDSNKAPSFSPMRASYLPTRRCCFA